VSTHDEGFTNEEAVMEFVERALQQGAVSPDLADKARWSTLSAAQNLDVFDTFCSFMDLGGYGSGLRACNWDLEQAQQQGLIQDLAYFFRMGAHSIPSPTSEERILVLNDAIARTVDPAPGIDMLAMTMYIRDLVTTHCQILYGLRDRDLGLRTVISGGQRIQYAPHEEPRRSARGDREIDVNRLFWNPGDQVVFNPFHFQMNTAFSRAFLIEGAGQAQGILPNRIYVDASWVEVWKTIFGRDPVMGNSACRGRLRFQFNGLPWLDLEYDAIVKPKIKKLGQPVEVFQLSNMSEYKWLDGNESTLPLEPDGVVDEFEARKAAGWPNRPR